MAWLQITKATVKQISTSYNQTNQSYQIRLRKKKTKGKKTVKYNANSKAVAA